jgi:hypothetical protein
MSQIFEVVVKATIVVVGDSAAEALVNARADMDSIKSAEYFDIEIVKPLAGEILPNGWDGNCIPYGDTDAMTIKEIYAKG